MEALELVCFKCKHFKQFEGNCSAFPKGIPDEITSGENEHSEKLPGQKTDLVFEPIEKTKAS